MDERYTEALDGLEDFSQVLAIFWMDQAEAPKSLKDHVQGSRGVTDRGSFRSACATRPNPIGVSAVPVLSREKNVLRVQALDAIDGTPVIDIKPYTPAFDRVENARTPEWCRRVYEIEDYL